MSYQHCLAWSSQACLSLADTVMVFLFLCIGLAIMGLTYGPIGTVLSDIFPTSVRYTGSALTFNLAGIFGASFAPLIATKLATGLWFICSRLLPNCGINPFTDRILTDS